MSALQRQTPVSAPASDMPELKVLYKLFDLVKTEVEHGNYDLALLMGRAFREA